MISKLKQRLFLRLPTNLDRLYRACKHYVDRHEGELNGDMDSNGEMWLARQLCPNAEVIFDVGANQGEWSRRVLALNPRVKLHAFEPSAHTFKQLIVNVQNITANQFGLSNSAKDGTLHSFGEGHGMNSLYERKSVQPNDKELKQITSENVKLDTVDNYCRQNNIPRVDFLKIDIEGHDLEALRGAASMLSRKQIGVIQFEYSACNLDSGLFLSDFFELLQSHGYQLAKLLPDAIRPVARYDRGLETFRYQNWVAFLSGSVHPPSLTT